MNNTIIEVEKCELVNVWLEVESQHYHPAIDQTVYQYFVLPLQGKTADRAIIDVNMEKLGKVLDMYEAILGTKVPRKRFLQLGWSSPPFLH